VELATHLKSIIIIFTESSSNVFFIVKKHLLTSFDIERNRKLIIGKKIFSVVKEIIISKYYFRFAQMS
jgi:hypothetical protein